MIYEFKLSGLTKNGAFDFDHQLFPADITLKVNDSGLGMEMIGDERPDAINVGWVSDIDDP
jgi:hypothetical protein